MKLIKCFWAVPLVLALSACGGGGSDCNLLGGAFCNTSESAVNKAPVAIAGPDQNVLLSTALVRLDGSASIDMNGDPLTYQWSLVAKPTGSVFTFAEPTSVRPSFVPDKLGAYVLSLVVSDGKLSSATSFVTVNVSEVNAPPVANAGVDQSVLVNAEVTLDGRDSSDANRDDELTFTWSLVKPDGSAQVLTGVRPTFTAALIGTYTASLTVRDAVSSSAPDAMRVVVSAVNVPPLAVISSLSRVNVGSVVQLSGLSSTDGNADPLTFKWALLSKPLLANGATANSVAALSSLTANNPVFTADLPGVYVVSLVVNDGKVNSDPVTVAITAIDPNDATGLTGLTGN